MVSMQSVKALTIYYTGIHGGKNEEEEESIEWERYVHTNIIPKTSQGFFIIFIGLVIRFREPM